MRVRLIVKVGQIMLAALGAALLSAVALGVPSQKFWQDRSGWVHWVILVPVVAATLLAIAEIIDSHFNTKGDRAALICQRQLIAVMYLVLEDKGLGCQDIGLHVFLKGWAWIRFRPVKIQRRVARLRLAGAPDDSGMLFTEGKGVIGECWALKAEAHDDWSVTWGKYEGLSHTEWNSLPRKETQGFTYEEFRLTGPNYGAIVAVPIKDAAEKYYGCVAIDGPAGREDLLWNERVRGRLYGCANGILARLRPRAPILA